VAVCYDEEPAEFTTPFSASCGAAPAACEPTRIRERVRFEVLQDCDDDEKALGPFERAELQMERCYAFLSRGPIANKISENDALITVAIRGEAKPPSEKQPNRFFDLFCQLRILFLQYLRSNPDRYDCALEENIRALNWPNATANSYGSDVKTVYTSLLGAMQSHAYNCILNELVFSCDEPSKACCVVLGSVEVVNGRITRVCNLPRQYVWTPANFANVLLFDLLTQRKQKRTLDKEWAAYDRASNQATPAPEKSCCPEIPFDAELFLRRHTLSSRYGVMAAHAAIFGLREFYSALGRSFDFTDLTRVSSQPAMQAESPEKMARVARELELDETIVKADFVAEPNPIQMLLAHTLKEARSPMAIYDRQTAGLNAEAWPSYVRSQSLDYQPLKEMELDLARAVDRQQPPPQTPPPAAPPTPPPPPPAAPPTTPAPSGQQAGADTAPAQSAPAQSAPAQAAPAQPAATQPAATPSTPSDARVLMKAMAAPRPRRRGLKKGEPQ
jgi:hypothetical protein